MRIDPSEEAKVSVVIPAYNCENYVRPAIESILNQGHKNLEVLVADDGSTDRTREIIDSLGDPRIFVHHNSRNLGYLKTVNKLLQISSGDFITFQDADDWSDLDRIALQLDHLKRTGVEICGTGIYLTSTEGDITGRHGYPTASDAIARNAFLGLSTVCYASLLFTRKVLEEVGGYREFFAHGAEDVDWFYRIIEKYPCENIDQALYYYRFSGTSITDSVNILLQIASLRLARDLATERLTGSQDLLQRGDLAGAEAALQTHRDRLLRQPFSGELYKINQLLRKRAYREGLRIGLGLLRKKGPWSKKLAVLAGCLPKMLLGVDNYRLLKHRLASMRSA